MGKKKTGRPCWFKLFDSHLELFEAAPPEAVKAGICSALRSLRGEEVETNDPIALMVFGAVKPSIDAAWDQYRRMSSGGSRGNAKRYMVSGGDTSRQEAIPGRTRVSGGIQKKEDRGLLSSARGDTAAPAVQGGERLVEEFDLGYLGVDE